MFKGEIETNFIAKNKKITVRGGRRISWYKINGGERFQNINDLVTIPTLSSINIGNLLRLPLTVFKRNF